MASSTLAWMKYRADGTHVHLIVPAMAGPIAAYFVPERDLRGAERDLRPYLPMIREVAKELGKLPGYRVRRSPKLY